ncbi:quinon protein alcohol dehydrogenase-like superfamily [Halteromyces radiatus]|uniref:quinon protein alcohol dehydrogenase-like superfamily n=1 Tax=Halteromyces radiatus TaxID=101107 RepID=UPI00221FBDED|nr:quinon protein alcohol dehydrogenase-like superfamily [Halteromyces radiatus]KAI8077692.1 quinon protein alcohol dehydrogenase-like superfamily [Halteromyces radiatus]
MSDISPSQEQQQQQQNYAQMQQYQQSLQNDSHSVILVTAGYDNTIRFWEALSGICSRTIQHADSQVNRLCISPDKTTLAAAGNHNVRLYDITSSNGNPLVVFGEHTGNITAAGFHGEGRWMFTASEDGHLKIWDTRSGRNPVLTRNFDNNAPINDAVMHANQGELITCDQNGVVKIWDLTAHACTHQLVPDEGVPLRSVSIASDGSMLVAVNNKGFCYVWKMSSSTSELSNVEPLFKWQAHNDYILRCVLSPDTKLLATCSADKTVKIWNAEKKFNLEMTLTGHQRWVWDCAFSADSAYLVTASSDHVARLWELSQGETIRQYNGHNKAAVCVALNDLSIGYN